ncbi:MAG: AAA family ATPase [Spirochaetes bacterium]|nr:AAA family ATPase [Spirochaetota bacterium]
MDAELEKQVKKAHEIIERVIGEYNKVVVGQRVMAERMLIGLLTGGHLLLEGVPGLAKTIAVKTMARISGLPFSRIQFTPDLMPSDLLGTQIYNQKTGDFSIKKGPLFSHVILADEINRAPSKVQSALLEAMQERQITIADESFTLEEPYLVMATQNPLEQEGTYPLPEAQVDRFLMKVQVGYPTPAEEVDILRRMSVRQELPVEPLLSKEILLKLRKVVDHVYMDDKLFGYIVDLVFATRDPKRFGIDPSLILYGVSPRGSIALAQAARAQALLSGESYVKTEDIKAVAYDVLRHRLALTYEAEAEGLTSQDLLRKVFEQVHTP